MRSLLSYLVAKENRAGLAILLVAALIAGGLAACAGMSLDDFVYVDVPAGIERLLATPDRVPLSEVPMLWAQWQNFVELNSEKFARSAESAEQLRGFLGSTIDTSLAAIHPAAAALPGGALIVSGLSFLSGLMFKRPGEGKAINQAKDEGYDMGRAEALDTLAKAAKPDGGAA